MIAYLAQVTLCLAIFYGFYLVALRKETTFQTNRIYLMSTMIVAILVPLIKIYFETTAVSASTDSYVFVGQYLDEWQQAVATPGEEKNIPWLDYFAILYGIGCLIMAARMAIEIYKILNLNKKGSHRMILGHRCIQSGRIQSPFSFFHTIYLPADHGFNADELKEVLDHEHSHISGRHSMDVLFIEIVKIFLWISPMIYLYRIKLREVHEFLADAAVIKNSPWERYAQFLVSQKYVGLQCQLSNQLIYSQLKNRIVMMTQQPSSMLAKWKYTGVIPVLLMALLIFSFRHKEMAIPDGPESFHSAAVTSTIDDNTEPPLFPGCEKVNLMEQEDCSHKKLFEYVAEHLKYPEEMKTNKIEGKVYVKFVITNNGLVAQAAIQKSLNPAADKAALDLVNGMNDNVGKWTPGTKEGVAVTMEMVLPISFVLGTSTGTKPGDGASAADKSEPFYFEDVDEMPTFPYGPEAIYKFIGEHIKYPALARKQGISGLVKVGFVVSKDGEIKNAEVMHPIGGGCDEEALRVINSMPKWKPGIKDGKAVSVIMVLPIKFELEAKAGENSATGADSSSKEETAADSGVFQYVEEMPVFPNGQEEMYKFIYERLKYPAEARQKEISGQVIIQFVVSEEGEIRNAKVLRGIGGGCNEEALRVVNAMPKWTPGKRDGKDVAVSFTLPIKFVLENESGDINLPYSLSPKVSSEPLHLSPNPARDYIVVDLFERALSTILVHGADGVLIAKMDVPKSSDTSYRIDLDKYPAGQYFIQVISDKEKRSGSFTVIK